MKTSSTTILMIVIILFIPSVWNLRQHHCVKSIRIRSFSGPYFQTFELNTERYGVSLRIQSKCGKIQTRKTRNTDTFHIQYIALLFARSSL